MKPTGRTFLFHAIMVAGLLSPLASAKADMPHLISVHGKWSAFNSTEDGKKVCYMSSSPAKMQTSNPKDKRGDVYALITDRPADGTKNVFSYITGYTYKPHTDVTVSIDKVTFTLFTQDDTAWARDGATDNKIAGLLRKGKTMIVKGISAHGVKTTDTFVLAGSGGAYDAISKDCLDK